VKKFGVLVLVLFVLGCAEYSSYAECELREINSLKLDRNLTAGDADRIRKFCLEFKNSSEMFVP